MQWLIDIIIERIGAGIPSGTILLWSGAIGDIPSGFVLCDGTNGTPNLGDKFVQGTINEMDVGSTGGSDNHTHAFTTNGHNHNLLSGAMASIAPGVQFQDITDQRTDTGTTNSTITVPPYHFLAYIMKT